MLIFGGWEYTKAQNEIIVLRECTNRNDQEMGDALPQAYDEDGMPAQQQQQMMDGGYQPQPGEMGDYQQEDGGEGQYQQ